MLGCSERGYQFGRCLNVAVPVLSLFLLNVEGADLEPPVLGAPAPPTQLKTDYRHDSIPIIAAAKLLHIQWPK